MVCGSLTNPEKNYHLEFTTHNKSLASSLSIFLNHFEIRSHIVERKDVFVVYVKDGDSISDFLNFIGAHDSMFKFEDIRVKKNLRNNVNRIVNCETANLLKITKGYIKHKKAIEYIINKRSIDYIPEDLRELALLRLSNESYSLKDLGEKLSIPLSKSGVNYRLKKIEDIAMDLYREEEEKWENSTVNAKSIMGVMALSVGKGESIEIKADGPDEKDAVDDLVNLIENELITV